VTTTLTNKPVKGQSLYYSKSVQDGETKEVFSTIEEAQEGGNVFDMTPIIFYVMKGPIVELASLPALDLNKLFYRSEQLSDYLRFSITQAEIDSEEILNLKDPDAEFSAKMQKIVKFDRGQDFELLRAIDKMRVTMFGDAQIDKLRET